MEDIIGYVSNNVHISSYIDNNEMQQQYRNWPTPPMSGSEGSQSPIYVHAIPATFDNMQFLNMHIQERPYLEITEEPIEKFRFRYKSEMAGTHGCLSGSNSDRNRRSTYPTVQLKNYDRPAIVRCSLTQVCPSIENPEHWQPHAHRLVQKYGLEEVNDPHDKEIGEKDRYIAVFNNMGIIHTARKYIIDELKKKKKKLKLEEYARYNKPSSELTQKDEVELNRVATEESKSINLNTVCLRFDAFFKDQNGALLPICKPVFSRPINNLKSALTGDLKICRMDRCSCPATGGKDVFLLVEKVTKKNIKVRFVEYDEEDNTLWQDYASFNENDVHHQYAIVIRVPPYKQTSIEKERKVFIELERPSDGAKSEALEFTYYPDKTSRRKRPRVEYNTSSSFSSGECPIPIQELMPEVVPGMSAFNSAEMMQLVGNTPVSEEFQRFLQSFNAGVAGEEFPMAHIDDLPPTDANMEISPLMSFVTDNARKRYNVGQKTEALTIQRAIENLSSVVKAQQPEDILKMLNYVLEDERYQYNQENSLHLMYSQPKVGYERSIDLFLDQILKMKHYKLMNNKNIDGETVLHVALKNCDQSIHRIEDLIKCTNLEIINNKGQTPLHYAVRYNKYIKSLLSSPRVRDFIDKKDYDGRTALQFVIEENNMDALKAFIAAKANMKVFDGTNGANMLQIAIEKGHVDIVRHLLRFTNIDIETVNYAEVNSYMLCQQLQDQSESHAAIFNEIDNKLKQQGKLHIFDSIKQEEDCTSDDELETEEVLVKNEPLTEDELREYYMGIVEFNTGCLKDLSDILNNENKWKGLPSRLDLDFVLSTNLYDHDSNPTKSFIHLALAKGISVYQIRMALHEMGEITASQCIDRMVQEKNA